MLKTLEEPPEHVKFVLATTDPQKIPVTVLSRCLQFNLKPLPRAAIAERLAHILDAEAIAYDAAALPQLAARRTGLAARRAFAARPGDRLWRRRGAGNRRAHDARRRRPRLSVIASSMRYWLRTVRRCSPKPMRWRRRGRRLRRRWMSWRRFSIGLPSSRPCRARRPRDEAERIAAYASRFPPESVQLAYQICAQGRADLALAPDEATGFSMTLLRLLAFEPATQAPSTTRVGPDTSDSSDAAAPGAAQPPVREPVRRSVKSFDASLDTPLRVVPQPRTEALPSLPATRAEPLQSLPETTAEWPSFVAGLKLTGMAAQLAAQSELKSISGNALSLAIPATHKHLADKAYADKLKVALERSHRPQVAACVRNRRQQRRLARRRSSAASARRRKREGEAAFRNEPFVRELVERFSATVRPETIVPLANANPSRNQEPS